MCLFVYPRLSVLNVLLQPCEKGDIVRATESGYVKLLDQCFNNGANIEEEDEDRGTALIIAAANGQEAAVDWLIAHKANVNHQVDDGMPALIRAAPLNRKNICEALLKAGADRNQKMGDRTAAQWAALQGHEELAAFIESWKPVLVCVSVCACVLSACFVLLLTSLCLCRGLLCQKLLRCKGYIIKAAQSGDVKKLEQCLDLGASIDEQDNDGLTALMIAARLGTQQSVDFLIEHKANVNLKTASGWTPLHFAATFNKKGACEALLKGRRGQESEVGGQNGCAICSSLRIQGPGRVHRFVGAGASFVDETHTHKDSSHKRTHQTAVPRSSGLSQSDFA